MRKQRISDAIGNINAKYIEEAACVDKQETCHRPVWIKWTAIAACLALLLIAGALVLPSLFTTPGKYKYQFSGVESDADWPWEYKTNAEKYQTISFLGREYSVKSSRTIRKESLGDLLGTCEASGFDFYTSQHYSETLEIRKLSGIAEEKMIAAGNANGFHVYQLDDTSKPKTFGELLDLYHLAENLSFNNFTKYEGYEENGHFTLNDDAYLWQILSDCRDAKLDDTAESFDRSKRNYLSFTATSEVLGVYKRVVYISEDGYFATNIFNSSYIYFIGEDAAKKILSYAENNSAEAEFSPYVLTIAGTLTEIGDDYVLIDDTALCKNPKDGVIYKVYTDDIRIKRCLACLNIEVGDIVGVTYEGEIAAENEIHDAYSLYKGTLVDGDLAIPE